MGISDKSRKGGRRGAHLSSPRFGTRSGIEDGLEALRAEGRRINQPADLAPLIDAASHARIVLIGEASHGTHEFYAMRAEITRTLIEAHGFQGVALEADWPDTFRVHRYVTGRGEDESAVAALDDFRRFPAWMWRNRVVVPFVQWLREWNAGRRAERRPVGMYGIDLYSMHTSIESVLGYLEGVDPSAARRARDRYGCFEHFSIEPQAYGAATTYRGKEPCEDEVVAQLVELRGKCAELMRKDGRIAEEDFFSAEQNARLVMNAERYYRSMFQGREESWNLRDTHMFETLLELQDHLGGADSRIVVWAHNSHLGNARATEMSERGELNLAQLVRERFGQQAFGIGFSTYTGTVTAASDWGAKAERKHVRPGLAGSYEELFHRAAIGDFWLDLRPRNPATEVLAKNG